VTASEGPDARVDEAPAVPASEAVWFAEGGAPQPLTATKTMEIANAVERTLIA